MVKKQKPVILCILDGWGLSSSALGNAPLLAHTPILDNIKLLYPNAKLITHGPDVGLPEGQMGNSEVGHSNIGAGRVVEMDLGKINSTIQDQTFFKKLTKIVHAIASLTTNLSPRTSVFLVAPSYDYTTM